MLNQLVLDHGYHLTREERPGERAKGETNFTRKTVWIRPDLTGADYVRTMTHELAHMLLHSPESKRGNIARPVAEIEAESTSYMVCKSLGIDTDPAAFAYLANWSDGETDLVKAVFDVIGNVQQTTTTLITTVTPHLEQSAPDSEPVRQQRQSTRRIDRNLVDEAKRHDPTSFLESRGYSVKWEGYNADVRENGIQVCRITRKPDGTYLVNSDHGDPRGDNIDLAKWVRGDNDFTAAVEALIGTTPIVEEYTSERTPHQAAPSKWEPPRLPEEKPAHRHFGRQYLTQRGISQQTIEHAERTGMLRYGNGGVLFVGLTETFDVGSAFRRGYLPDDPTPKRDLRGSQKRYAPILYGRDHTRVWIVEGGMDALALHDIHHKAGKPTPTVIIAGGAGSTAYTQPPHLQEILSKAERITIAGDNDPNPETQAKTAQHRAHAKTAIQAINPTASIDEWIPTHAKDIADLNQLRSTRPETVPKVPKLPPNLAMTGPHLNKSINQSQLTR
ncbi:hypothetical protein [Stomatohabitans albus]|uniref:hypothetical protein n=1 Tax=Stomatohabitans albus TaxID=3110766 RepID=UPI00300C23DC